MNEIEEKERKEKYEIDEESRMKIMKRIKEKYQERPGKVIGIECIKDPVKRKKLQEIQNAHTKRRELLEKLLKEEIESNRKLEEEIKERKRKEMEEHKKMEEEAKVRLNEILEYKKILQDIVQVRKQNEKRFQEVENKSKENE